MKKNLNLIGVLILVGIFAIFYLIASYFLDRRNLSKDVPAKEEVITEIDTNYEKQKNIVSNAYNNFRMLYDVVNNKFTVDNDNTITIGDNTYKKITNFDEIMNSTFTKNGIDNYITNLNNYFAYTEDGYYLIGNLINYQTYYFRGDETNIYIMDAKDDEINAIIYERWTSNNKNTLATVKLVMTGGKWLVDDIDILKTE